MKRVRAVAWICAWLAMVHPGQSSPAQPFNSIPLGGRAMGTAWSVTIRASGSVDAPALQRTITARLEELEQQFSTYRARSELSLFNTQPDTDWIAVSPEIALVATEARRISQLTGGAFDATVAPLVRLWGFGPQRRTGDLPSENEIQSTRRLVDWRDLEVRPQPAALRKRRANLSADFSSLVKGFAADVISEQLTTAGAPDHLVQIGGDTRSGPAPRDSSWRVAVERASDRSAGPAVIISLTKQSLSTSGNYRNFFTSGGQRHGHIIDPRTGRPVDGSLASVSVVHPSCATSSALATALFVLGAEDAWRFATEHNLPCLLQVRQGAALTQRITPEFAALLVERRE